jgi:type IV secretion system protein VirB9
MFATRTCLALAAALGATQPTTTTTTTTATPATPASTGGRSVVYHDRDVVALHAKVRYTTLIVLPENDEVVEVTCGDKETWAINARGSLVSAKPAKARRETNLNVLTSRGQIYAFLLTEISDAHGDPDLIVYLERENGDAAPRERPKFVPAREAEDFRLQAEIAREDARRANESARAQLDEGLTSFRRRYPLTLVFPYRFKAGAPPFFVTAMFHDDRATYIQAHAPELPALYELRDGKPNLVNFEVRDGTYVVSKVLDQGYLAIGNRRLAFERARH